MEDKILEPVVEESKQEDNSTIKNMRAKIESQKEEIRNLKTENSEEIKLLKEQINNLSEKDLVTTYGADKLSDAKRLIAAGFKESEIKSMLNKKDNLQDFDNPTEPLIEEIKGEGKVEEKEVDEMEEFEKELLKKIANSKL